MIRRLTPIAAALTAMAVMAIGGVALANSTSVGAQRHAAAAHKAALSHGVHAAQAANSAAETTGSGVDRDNIQSGDQSAPDQQNTAGQAAAGEGQSANEQTNDGPGGHADGPGNENADHQFEGQE